MAYPILAPNSTWFAQGGTTVKRASITEIEIMDSYTPDASVTVTDSWDASAAKDGSIMCYVIGTKLIMAGNGSGKIAMNEDSTNVFSDSSNNYDYFASLNEIHGLALFDTCKVNTMYRMFACCQSLKQLDLSSWDVQNVTNIGRMFLLCNAMTVLNVTGWDTTNIVDLEGLLMYDAQLKTIIGIEDWQLPNIECIAYCFMSLPIYSLSLHKWNVSKVTNFYGTFAEMPNIINIDISNWNMQNAQNCGHMFRNCKNLKNLLLPASIHVGNDANGMFHTCSSLINLDTTMFDTSSCTDMCFMFYSCSSLKEIDVSNWDVSKVTNFDHFAAHANLKRKGIENWKTTSATNMNALFHNCAEEELDLSGWDVSKNQFFCQMFENSPNLKRVKGLDKWNTSAGLGFDGMFERCGKLEEVDLSSFNTSKAKNNVQASANNHKTATLQNMFLSCNNLKKVTLGANFSINGDGSNTAAANKLILPTPSADYIEGADGNWYTFIGDAHAPNAVKDKTVETYYASYSIVADQDVIVKNGSLIDTAKAIREKNGTTNRYTPSQFGAAIRVL